MSWDQFRVNGCGLSNFSTWFDRHNGRGWCWRERDHSRAIKTGEEDVTTKWGYPSRRAAVTGTRDELTARCQRAQAAALITPGG